MDDPIFDPWCLGEEARPAPPHRGSRWRSTRSSQGIPAGRPAPTPLGGVAAERAAESPAAAEPFASDPERAPEVHHPDDVEAEPSTLLEILASAESPTVVSPESRPVEPASEEESAERPSEGRGGALSRETARLEALIVPRIEALSRRLVLAGHRTRLDDRLAKDPPSLRFRVEPRRGPFDPPGTGTASVLEFVVEGDGGRAVAGKIWLDPLARRPTERRGIRTVDLEEAWVDRLLVEFIERTLARA